MDVSKYFKRNDQPLTVAAKKRQSFASPNGVTTEKDDDMSKSSKRRKEEKMLVDFPVAAPNVDHKRPDGVSRFTRTMYPTDFRIITDTAKRIVATPACDQSDILSDLSKAIRERIKMSDLKLTSSKESADYDRLLKMIDMFTLLVSKFKSLEIDAEVTDSFQSGVVLNSIRKYIYLTEDDDLTNGSLHYEDTSYTLDGITYEFYSQLPDDESRRIVRTAMNDTDVTRSLFLIDHLVKIMISADGFLCPTSVVMINITMLLILGTQLSAPVEKLGDIGNAEIAFQMLGYTLYSIIDTRVISRWLDSTSGGVSAALVHTNYNNANPFVQILRLRDPAERANLIISEVYSRLKIDSIKKMKHKVFMDMAKNYIHEVANDRYYVLGSDFLLGFFEKEAVANALVDLVRYAKQHDSKSLIGDDDDEWVIGKDMFGVLK